MFASSAWFLLLSPADVVESTVARSAFPKGFDSWDRIGLFKLKDGDKERLVLLYYYDSDSVGDKEMKKTGFGTYTYPNSFRIYAVYQGPPSKWIHQKVFGYARVRFTKVAKAAPDRIVLECRPNFMVFFDPGETEEKASMRAKEINKPFTRELSFVGGVLTAK